MSDLKEQIAAKRAELERLERKKQELDAQTPLENLADAIHAVECHWNHADGCGWFYESWAKPGFARNRAMDTARKIADVEDNIQRITRILHMIRKPQQ